ncbi:MULTISPECIES: DUF2867 domain-containing protein [Kribbella]|jgi:hypothetical protein|uniref:Uncharacterized protein DUF2867 n=1 Tax=Kribbella pratensis TaxID=2512112 RepID=A0ABY2FDH6_9ACTN|nr:MULTISPECIES: DUF2867 domain-containing protein [Kribbella]TDW88286.1 uncharacterized protein DUF2867 [Kribbella pratensis]TDW88501.1 uncharacterized protein DUF2867 [Kribbella sp. VKM Ac-2566]
MPTTLHELDDLVPVVDEIDVKTGRGDVTLREFVAGALGHSPLWVKGLFAVRMAVAAVLRLETTGVPDSRRLRPETVSFTPGEKNAFFTVVRGEEDHYLLLKVSDNHLDAWLAFITDNERPATFKVVTLVQFLRPAGRFYYNLIRPFHHVILLGMCRAGETWRDRQ